MFYRIGNSMFNADAHFWYTRTQSFTKAVLKGNWAETYQNPKPGVTVMWMSGAFLESFLRLYEKIYHFRPFIYTYDTFPYIETAVKLPLILLTIISLLFFYRSLKRFLGNYQAMAILILLAFEPFYIGVSRFFHGDGTLTSFMMLSVISIFIYLAEKRKKYLFLSGVFAGLAFLTKMQAIFLFLYVPLLLFINYLSKFKQSVNILGSAKLFIKDFLVWLAPAVVTILLLFPALWVKPVETLKSMFTEARVVTEEGRNSNDGDNLAYLRAIPTIIPFAVTLFFILGIYFLALNFKKLELNDKKIFSFSLIFIFFYTLQMLLVYQKSERYLLPLFPFISIIAGYGFTQTSAVINKIIKIKSGTELSLYTLFGGFVIYTTTFAPHFTAMTETAPWGSLYSEAAGYLNAKPNAVNLNVVAVTKEQTFRPFFMGKTYGKGEIIPGGTKPNNETVSNGNQPDDKTIPGGKQPDYVIIHDITYLPEKYKYCTFEHKIVFKNRVFWEIYKCK